MIDLDNISPLLREEHDNWGGYDWDKPSLALVAVVCRPDHVPAEEEILLYAVGGHVRLNLDEHGLDWPAFAPADSRKHLPESGLYVWEGRLARGSVSFEGHYDGDELRGAYRLPTTEEIQAFLRGESPWNNEDWLLPEDDSTS